MIVTLLFMFAFVFATVAALGVTLPRLQFGWLAFALFMLGEVILRVGGVR